MDATASIDFNTVSRDPVPSILCTHCDIYPARLHDGTRVALKTVIIYEALAIKEASRRKERMSKLLDIWAKCDHPNIVQMIGRTRFLGQTNAVYEWHEYGSVRKYLERNPMVDRCQLSAQICEGLAYLHANDIIHGELNGDQILVSGDGTPQIQLSVESSTTMIGVTKSKAWTQWTAPEIATGSKPTFSSDIYSLGMTILETITGDFPYGPTFCLSSEGRAASSPFLFGLRKFIAVDFSAPFGNSQPKSSHSKVTRDIIPSRPKDKLPENTSGNVVWDVLCKCWLPNSTDRPSAGYICAAMRTVHQTLDGIVLMPFKLAITEETTVQDLVTHYEQRYLRNYTEVLQRTGITTAIPFADTALANVYKIDLPNQESIAVKCVKHTTPYKRLKRAARELSCWSLNVHENILPVLGFAVVKGELAMISPWMSNGCITDYINTHPTADLLELCIQLTQAIAYLHKYDVIHGDIKSANVLISDTHQVKVTDFGVSITDHQEIEFTSTSSNGTQRWQAPEVLRGDTDSTKEGDIYSLSMTIIEIYTGERPYGSMDWNGQTTMKVFKNQLRPSRPLRIIPDKQGDKLWKLLNQCWAGTPSHRPTSAEVYRRLSGSRGGGHAKRLDEEWMALELELDRSSTHGPVANSTPVRSLFRKFL